MAEYCSVCRQPFETTKRCAKCKCIRYCSMKCQKIDWDYHKIYCNSFSAFWKSQQDKFENFNEPLSSKMLEFWFTTSENLNKIKQLNHVKSLVVSGCLREAEGFAYDIKCFSECENLFNETELSKIQDIPLSFDCNDIDLVIYKLYVDEQTYEIIHVVTMGSG